MTGSPVLDRDPGLLFDPGSYWTGVPHDEFARRRREAPVAWVEETPLVRRSGGREVVVRGSGYWAVTRHATIHAASRRREIFSSGARGAFLPDPKSAQELAQMRRLLINMDPPDHARIRATVADTFKPRTVLRLHDAILAEARRLIAELDTGDPFDAVRDLCAELPLLAIADLMGMPRADRGKLFEWSNNLVGIDDPDLSAAQVELYKRAFAEAHAYARALAGDKRIHPGDDLATVLVRDALDRGVISEVEFCNLFLMLVIAGNESTRHLLSGSLAALMRWPEERRRLGASPDLIPSAVEELVRFVSPIMQFRRTALVDTELDGQPVRAGDKVVLYYISGNYDEDVFGEPRRLDLGRSPNPHLGFGFGPHYCLGAALARVEARALLAALGPALYRLEPTGEPRRLRSNFVNGLKSLPVRFARSSRA